MIFLTREKLSAQELPIYRNALRHTLLASSILFGIQSMRRSPMTTLLSFVQFGVLSGGALFGSSFLNGGVIAIIATPSEDKLERIKELSCNANQLSIWLVHPSRSQIHPLLGIFSLTVGAFTVTKYLPNLSAWITGWVGGALLLDWALVRGAQLGISHFVNRRTSPTD